MATTVNPGTTFTLPAVSDGAGSAAINVDWVVFLHPDGGGQGQVVAESLHPSGWAVALSTDLTQITVTVPPRVLKGLYSAHRNVPGDNTHSYGTFFCVELPVPRSMTGQAQSVPPAINWAWQLSGSLTPDSYNLYVGRSPGAETLRQAGITTLQFLDTTVATGLPNSAYVTAVYAGAESGPSNRFVITAREPPVPCPGCPAMF